MEIITAEESLLTCQECCHLKDTVIALGLSEFHICVSCLQEALRLLKEVQQ